LAAAVAYRQCPPLNKNAFVGREDFKNCPGSNSTLKMAGCKGRTLQRDQLRAHGMHCGGILREKTKNSHHRYNFLYTVGM